MGNNFLFMKWTRASVEEDAKAKNLEPVQIDGIPEGFSWKEPDVTIGGKEHKGKYVLYGQLGYDVVRTDEPEGLVKVYDSITKKTNHPMHNEKENLERTRREAEDKKGN